MIKSMVIDALIAIQAGQNPRVIETMLRTYLPGASEVKGRGASQSNKVSRMPPSLPAWMGPLHDPHVAVDVFRAAAFLF